MDYTDEPPHSGLLSVRGTRPFNAEPLASALVEFKLTPEELLYCRNHGPVREFDPEEYTVNLGGSVQKELKLRAADLRKLFPTAEVIAALQVGSASVSRHSILMDDSVQEIAAKR